MGDDDSLQGRIVPIPQSCHVGEEDLVAVDGSDWKADIEHDPLAVGLELNAAPSDLVGTP